MIQSVWIEIRPSLRCCHVCAVLQKNIDSKVQIKVKKSSFILQENNVTYEVIFPDFIVEPMTMANFKCTNRFLNFRVQVECTFKHQSLPTLKVNPPIFSDKMSSLHCQCHNPLTSKIMFDRILPLPSKDINVSDLFCHATDSAMSLGVLNPKPNDCLYADDFIIVNNKILTGCFKKEKLLKCKRCTATVGVLHKNSIKIWKSDIYLPFDNFTPLKHFKYLVQKAIEDPFSIFPKILLECEENYSSLSIVIVDKNLVISTCQEDLQLKNSEVVKLKYKFNAKSDPQDKVNNDFFNSESHTQVSKTTLAFIVQYLTSTSKKIPFIFGRENDDCMAYLNLSE